MRGVRVRVRVYGVPHSSARASPVWRSRTFYTYQTKAVSKDVYKPQNSYTEHTTRIQHAALSTFCTPYIATARPRALVLTVYV